MKELEINVPHVSGGTKTELNVKKRQEIEYVLEGTIKPMKGHKVWEINEENGDINEAEYKRDTVHYLANGKLPAPKMVIKADCIYIPALNKENAKQKYLKNKEQSYYYAKPSTNNINDIYSPKL